MAKASLGRLPAILFCLVFGLLGWAPGANAQGSSAAPVIPGYITTGSSCPTAVTPCFIQFGTSTPIASAAAESSHVLKAGPGALLSASLTAGASAGFLMIFDAVSAPADGAVTPKFCLPVGANAAVSLALTTAATFATGITAVFSTTGCFTKTASATAFIVGQVQ